MKKILGLLAMSVFMMLGLPAESKAQAPCAFCNESKDCQDTPKGFSGNLGCQSGWNCGNASCEHSVKTCWFTGGGCTVPRDDEGGGSGGGNNGDCGSAWDWQWDWGSDCEVTTENRKATPVRLARVEAPCASAVTRNGAAASRWVPASVATRRSDD